MAQRNMGQVSANELRAFAKSRGFDIDRSSVKSCYRILEPDGNHAINPDTRRPVFSVEAALRYLAERPLTNHSAAIKNRR